MKNKLILFAFLLAPLLLGACAKIDSFFSDTDKAPLTGERVSILQLQKELVPNPELQQMPIVLPEPWTDKFWPQAGGYAHHAMGHLTLGKDLKRAWKASIGSGGDRRRPLIAQPIVAEGIVFTLDTEGNVTAFNLVDGAKKWRVPSVPSSEDDTGAIGGGIAYAASKLYVTNGYKQLICLDATNGNVLWRTPTPSPARAAPSTLDDKVYLITLDNKLMVFSAADGAPLWNYAGVTETTSLLGSVSPAVDSSIVVLPLSSGEIFGLRVENGQVVWEDNLSSIRRVGTLSSIADIRGQPVLDNGVVYAASYGGRMVAIDAVSGQRIWQREIGSAEMPWAAGNTVFIISAEQQLIALTRNSGDIHWITSLPRFEEDNKERPLVWTGPVLAGERLILASNGGQIIEADPINGKILKQTELRWSSRLAGSVTIAPLVADNTLLLLTQSGELVAYR